MANEHDCERCGRPQSPQSPQRESGRLFLWPPLGYTKQKLRAAFEANALAIGETPDQAGLIIPVGAERHAALATLLAEQTTPAEARDSRALFMVGEGEPGFAQLGQVETLATYIARGRGAWLQELLHAERVTTHFQPIFHVAEPARVFAHECLLRGIDDQGHSVSPGLMFELAAQADLVFVLDRLARITAVRNAAAHGVDSRIFINFTPAAVYDPVNCLKTTVAAVERSGLERERIVFEVIETERISDPEHLANVLNYYREAGFRIALDDLGGGYAGLGLLPSLRPDFVKLDRSLVAGVSRDRARAIIIERVTQMAHDLGIEVVAEGVEQAEDLVWLQAHAVDYVQGFLLARPAPTPHPSQ